MNIEKYSQQLQSLSKSYANNNLSYAQYRQQRKLLLDELDSSFNEQFEGENNQDDSSLLMDEDVTRRNETIHERSQHDGPLGRLINRIIKK